MYSLCILSEQVFRMSFPDFLEPFRKNAELLIEKKAIRDLFFSSSTYYIEVVEGDTSYWVFLQLGSDNEVKDILCSCEESSENGACSHMAGACLFVFSFGMKPLHMRFERSFWNLLFTEYFKACELDLPQVVQSQGLVEVRTQKNVKLFSLKPNRKTLQKVKDLVVSRREETEENSIKFSNLSESELGKWHKGAPSFSLRYELSLFSDVAKFLFYLEEMNKLDSLEYVLEKKVPKAALFSFEDLHVTCEILPQNIDEFVLQVIPLQNKVFGVGQEKRQATFRYDSKKKTLIEIGQIEGNKISGGTSFWEFSKEKGFQIEGLRKDTSFHSPKLITQFFDEEFQFGKDRIEKYRVDESIHRLQYKAFLNSDNDLQIETFLFEPEDLDLPHSWFYANWAFCEPFGFFRIEQAKFPHAKYIVKKEEMTSFFFQHRAWLSQIPGFQVHIAKYEEELLYEVLYDGSLVFHSKLQEKKHDKNVIDLGDWIFVDKEGFYMKKVPSKDLIIPQDAPIIFLKVPEFIRSHVEILHTVPSFFSKECPIQKVALDIRLKKRKVVCTLIYFWHYENEKRNSRFYDEYVFIQGKGFFRIPSQFRLEHLNQEILLSHHEAFSVFIQETLPKLKQEHECFIDPRLEKANLAECQLLLKGQSKDLSQDKNLFDVVWKSALGSVSLFDLLDAKAQNERFVPTQAGIVDLEDERFLWLKFYQNKKVSKQEGIFLHKQDLLRLGAYEAQFQKLVEDKNAIGAIVEKLKVDSVHKPCDMSMLQTILRNYQQIGVEWLWFLYQNNLSGLLCDDMGVGKTHQAMGLFAAIYKEKKNEKRPLFFIACPTSLVFHWHDKLAKFLPELRVNVYAKQNRSLEDLEENYDVVVTSYGILRNEYEKLKKFSFEVAVFDELQIAKNHESQIYSALMNVNARMRLGLTGTPIENNLRELKSLFDLILPGFMPQESEYRELFIRPIEKESDAKRKDLLSSYVKPFVLRRRKQDVLSDLPEKTEEILSVELIGEQKTLYKQVALEYAFPLIEIVQDQSQAVPYMHIFALLSSLKQICNHPAAYLKDVENYEQYESGKWDLFTELIEEAEESDQKVVVFSQYLFMLDIIKKYLEKNNILYAEIRGQTKNRKQAVDFFQNDPQCKVFLGSLQAAGLGIDLTAASIVIHYDRWWNAARENQATDRVHRIGQTRGVQVFKFVTQSSVEENIDTMISKKSGLLEDIIAFDDHQMIKKMSRDDIVNLLESITKGL